VTQIDTSSVFVTHLISKRIETFVPIYVRTYVYQMDPEPTQGLYSEPYQT